LLLTYKRAKKTTIIKVFAWHPIIIYLHAVGGTTICLAPLDYKYAYTDYHPHTKVVETFEEEVESTRSAQQDETLLDWRTVGCTGGVCSVYGRHPR